MKPKGIQLDVHRLKWSWLALGINGKLLDISAAESSNYTSLPMRDSLV